MRLVGISKRVLDAMCWHAMVRKTIGKELLRQVEELAIVLNGHCSINYYSK